MALVAPLIQKEMEAAILSSLTRVYASEAAADPASYQKMAEAIAEGVTQTLIKAIQTQAQVLPGIATVGAPNAHISVTPGQIF
jgi:hypothetical protein